MDPNLIEINEITDILSFLQSIDWNDTWLILLIMFHLIILLLTYWTRNHSNFQMFVFFALLMMVYFSDSINELGATHWKSFSKQQYFDSKGLFISVVFSMPILFCCMVLIGTWLWQSTQLLSKLKIAQLKQQMRRQASTNVANADSKKYD